MSLIDTTATPPMLGHSPELTTSANNQANAKDLSLLALDGSDQNVLMITNSTTTKSLEPSAVTDTLDRQQQQQLHHHYHHHHHHHHHHLIQPSISKTVSSHHENTSFIIGTNQETDSVAAYTYTPITSPSSSPLITPTDLETTIMSDDIINTSTTNTNTSTFGGDKEDNTNALIESKKKSIRSRFKEVLKKSNLSSKTSGGGVGTGNYKNRSPAFTFLPSSSSPIPNTSQSQRQRQLQTQQQQLIDIGKRHSTSSALLEKTQHLQEKHNNKARSWQPPLPSSSTSSPILTKESQQQRTTNTNANLYHQYHHYHVHHIDPTTPQSPLTNAAISPLFLASPLVDKDDDNCSPSSSTSSLTTPSPLTPSDTTAIGDSSATLKEGNGVQMPFSPSLSPTPFAASSVTTSMPPSRFLTAFQKLRQQKTTMDTNVTTSGSMAPPIAHTAPRLSLDAVSITPSPSVAATASKSTSFAEKIKTRFQSSGANKLDQRPSSRLPTPVLSKSVAPTGKATKNSNKPVMPARRSGLKSQSPLPLSSASSASPMAQSWSHFSRTFVPSCSVQHASSRYSPKKSKQDKMVSTSPQQNRANMGKAQRIIVPSSDRSSLQPTVATNKRSLQRKQHQVVKTTVDSTKQQTVGQKPTATVISTPCQQIETRDDTSTTSAISVYGYPFDADAQVIQGNMIISPTCSIISHHSSSSTLSATVSTSSISTSESPSPIPASSESLNVNSNVEIKLDIINNGNTLLNNANKSASSLSATSTATCSSTSNLSFSSAQSSPVESTASKSSLAPVILSSPTPTATKTNTSTNPSAILILKNKTSSSSSRLTLKSPKRNLTEPVIKSNKASHKAGSKSHRTDPTTTIIKQQSLTKKKKLRVRFISTAKVQDTFSKHDYDRASDPYAVCTHLTAHLAQQIKDELNAFKLEEMKVHDLSRGNTQFFL